MRAVVASIVIAIAPPAWCQTKADLLKEEATFKAQMKTEGFSDQQAESAINLAWTMQMNLVCGDSSTPMSLVGRMRKHYSSRDSLDESLLDVKARAYQASLIKFYALNQSERQSLCAK